MKNLFKNLLLLTTVLSLTLMFSCGDEDPEDDVTPDGPSATVDVKVNGSTATSPATVEVGDEITADIDVLAPGNFNVFNIYVVKEGSTIATLDFRRADSLNIEDWTDFNASFTIMEVHDSLAGSEITLEFEVVDDNSEIGTPADFILDVDESIETRNQLLFGAQGNSEPGFYNVVEDVRYTYANARDNSGSVDFAYYWGQDNQSTIAAIDDEGLNAVYTAVELPIQDVFAERNGTRFVETDLTVEEYNEISSATELQNASTFEVGGSSSITELEEGDILAYQLIDSRGGTFGLIRVVSIDDTNGEGNITIEVKAQVEVEED